MEWHAYTMPRAAAFPDSCGRVIACAETLSPTEFVALTKTLYGEGVTPPGIDVWRGSLTDPERFDD